MFSAEWNTFCIMLTENIWSPVIKKAITNTCKFVYFHSALQISLKNILVSKSYALKSYRKSNNCVCLNLLNFNKENWYLNRFHKEIRNIFNVSVGVHLDIKRALKDICISNIDKLIFVDPDVNSLRNKLCDLLCEKVAGCHKVDF